MSGVENILHIFSIIKAECNGRFSIENLIFEISALRGKPIIVEEHSMPMGITGCAVPLRDIDLILIRHNLDLLRKKMTIFHELGHIALNHINQGMTGSENLLPTFDSFKRSYTQKMDVIIYRSHNESIDKQQEYEAEYFAQLCFELSIDHEYQFPNFAKFIYGD